MSEFKKFPGQPILSQILNVIPSTVIHAASRKHNANRYYKRLPLRLHLVSLLYGVFSYCNGLREVCEGLLACEGKLSHLGLDKAPARSTLSDANNKRSYRVFETIYYGLLRQYHSFISDSRLKGLSIRNLKVVDSSTIQLFSEILRGVGRARGDGSRKKGGFKVHAMMDAFSGVTEFVRLTEAREHDQKFLHHLKLPANSWLVFDKAYTTYHRFAKWSEQQIWFVTRERDNALFHVTKVLIDRTRRHNRKGVLKEQYVTVGIKQNGTVVQRLKLRRITFKSDEGKVYMFITNNFTLPACQIATIYKNRWMIELLFKQIKQNFPLRYFWGESPNAIKMQVYCVLIAQLLMVVIRRKAATKKSFSNMITVIRLHLMSYVGLLEFIKDTYKAWRKIHNAMLEFSP
ncbi:IS4 transposase [Chitinophaga niastensis]|uniref:IS4 transposase n=1 Tax=Chitinophaga niastensis TaxID=536980 RepID=A0A2P8H2U0_CHINA|nr:IS4 family transposase [Chitinophaga niastensis]PSL40531.1 IS4 transposase [Chitinophaga niastensis]